MRVAVGRGRDTLGLAVLLVPVFMGQIDMFAVTVAAPSMQRELGVGFGELRLIVSGYVLAYAAGLITGGRLGGRYGRRDVFAGGAAAFTVASLCCGLAPSGGTLIVARVAQGAAAAVLMPQVLATIRATFTDGARRERAVGAYGAVIGFGVIAGLIGGGLLVAAAPFGLGWRSIFLLNVPFGASVVALAPATVADSRDVATPRLDLAGALLGAVALVALLLPLSLPATGWLGLGVGLCGVGLAAVFLAHQRSLAGRGREPIVPPRLFGHRGFGLGMVAVVAFYVGNAGGFLVLTYYLQGALGLGAFATGLGFAPLGVGFAVASACAGRVSGSAAVFGTGLMAGSLLTVPAITACPPGVQGWLLAAMLGVSGFGQGLVVATLIGTVLSLIGVADAGAGSGVLNTVLQVGMVAGVAVIGALYGAVLGADPAGETAAVADAGGALNVVALSLAGLAVLSGVLLRRLRSVAAASVRGGAG